MSAFANLLDSLSHPKPVASVPAAELGEGEVVHICPLGIGAALKMHMAKEQNRSGVEVARELLPLCLCKGDGTPFFEASVPLTDKQWQAIDRIPVPLAMRIVEAATELAKEAKEAAKKASPATSGSAS